jgi:ElaB/YqjD/DUF883 family membrane-anchored ribosome-binding protein
MPPHEPNKNNPDDIAAMLERDRQDLAVSLEGLRSRLSPDLLISDAMGYAKANLGPYARALDGAVRANPMAAVATGVGLAWLVLGRRTPAAAPAAALAGTKFEALSRWEDEGGPPAPDHVADSAWIAETDALRHRALGALARIEAAARDRLRPATEVALDRARILADLAGTTRAAMLRGLDSLTQEARNRVLVLREEAYAARLAAERQGTRLIEAHPVLTGAIGMAIGAAVASALPTTQTEDRLFGQERDRLMSKAAEALRQERARAAGTVSRLADTVAAEVKISARDLVLET